jgi:3-dehydroquinate dehydratase II
MHVSVLNGVNLGMLGKRQPDIYGTITLSELETRIYSWSASLGVNARCVQTDHEGEYVEAIHDALSNADGVIVNPGAWTHYSYAIRDALAMLEVPVIEVHLSDVNHREEWRRRSVIEDVVRERIVGHGVEGYREALERLAGKAVATG